MRLAVLGMVSGNSTVPLPPWLSEVIPAPSFVLNAEQPYYIPAGIFKDGGPKSGTYNLLISEFVGAKHFVVPQKITIMNMWL